MSQPLLRPAEGGILLFWCPGCKCAHYVDPKRWTISGPPEAPTITPSVLCTTPRWSGPPDPDPAWSEGAPPERCHLFVRAGKIEFLADCTHELAGQTVPMEPV